MLHAAQRTFGQACAGQADDVRSAQILQAAATLRVQGLCGVMVMGLAGAGKSVGVQDVGIGIVSVC